jgi:hypothetical protein
MSDASGAPEPGGVQELIITPKDSTKPFGQIVGEIESTLAPLGGRIKRQDESLSMIVVAVPGDSVAELTSSLGSNFQIDPNAPLNLIK